MAMTRKQVKAYVDYPHNWAVIQGNQFVQIALLTYPNAGLNIAQIQYSYDLNHWKKLTNKDGYEPRIVWQGDGYWHYDPRTWTLYESISRTQLENMIYELEHKNEI